MERFRWWPLGRSAAFAALLFVAGCGGQSASSDERDGERERGGADSGGAGRGGSSSGGSPRGGTSSGGSARGGTNAGGAVTGGTGGGSTLIVLEDPNNYEATSDLFIPSVETAPTADLTICWTNVTSDLACQTVDPELDIGAIGFLGLTTGSERVATDLLNTGELNMNDIDAYLGHETDHESTCTDASSFTNFGTPVDFADHFAEDPERSYLFMATRGTAPGASGVSMIFARPVSSSTNTRIDLPPGCGLHVIVTDLDAVEPVRFPYDTAGIVDFGHLTRDGQGNGLALANLDRLVLSFFAGATLSDLEARIVELDANATESYELELTGAETASLYDAVSPETGTAFDGFRRPEAGIWLLRLMCTTCTTPMPPVLVVLEPF